MAVVSAPVTFIFVRCVPVLLTAWFGGWSALAEVILAVTDRHSDCCPAWHVVPVTESLTTQHCMSLKRVIEKIHALFVAMPCCVAELSLTGITWKA